jgi:hypothetical protein
VNRYSSRFIELMEKATVYHEDLPVTLQNLIEKFENAVIAWRKADDSKRNALLPVLVKADAVIAANIYQLYKDRFETDSVDKVKLMALKAKALQLKWRMKNS